MKKFLTLCLTVLWFLGLLASTSLAQEEAFERDPSFVYAFSGPFTEGTERALDIAADGEGGFYLLTAQQLYHWDSNEQTLTSIGFNTQQLHSLACNGQLLCALSAKKKLYGWHDGNWEGFGPIPWMAEKSEGPIYVADRMALGPDRLFFFGEDDEEHVFLCTYMLETGAFSYENERIFSRAWCVYDDQNDRLIGIVRDKEGDHEFLASYDYKTKEITLKCQLQYPGYVQTYDLYREWMLVGNMAGMLVGPSEDMLKRIPGISGRFDVTPLDETHIAGIQSIGTTSQEVRIYEYGMEELVDFDYE